MNLHRLCLALGTAGLLLATPLAGSTERSRDFAHSGPSSTGGRVIVTYKQTRASAMSVRIQSASQASTPLREAQTLNQRHGLDLRDGRTIAPGTQVLTSATLSNERLVQTLSADPDVASVSIDQWRHPHAAPNDPLYAVGLASPYPSVGQWYLRAPNSTAVSSINAEGAWNTTSGSSSVIVAVVDTGVRPEHPDLIGKILPGFDFILQTATSNDGDAADGNAVDPGDWISTSDLSGPNKSAYSDCTSTSNSSWHGTQTAALIGATTNNQEGMASVARNVMVLPVRVLGKCGGFDSDIISGMRWAAGLAVAGAPANPNRAKIINLSLGSRGNCSSSYNSVVAELNQAGVLVVASAGNDDLPVNTPGRCPGVVAVAGLRHAGDKSGYSSLGREVAISAPGGNCDTLDTNSLCQYPIVSATNTGTQGPISSSYTNGLAHNGFFDQGLGTSFSAPLVSATAALMLATNPNLSTVQIKDILASTARAFPATGGQATTACANPPDPQTEPVRQVTCYCTTTTCGAGMLDTQAAVQAAAAGRAVAHLGGTNPVVAPGASITIDGSGSTPASSATLSTYLWEVIDGASLATITSAANASSVTLNTSASTTSGTFTVKLTVTDSLGNSGSATQVFTVGTAPSIVTTTSATTTTTESSSGGGGGGAFDLTWAALALLSGLAAWRGRSARHTRH